MDTSGEEQGVRATRDPREGGGEGGTKGKET